MTATAIKGQNFMDNDDMMSNLQDPFDRLNEMEEGLLNHAHHIEKIGEQVKGHGVLLEKISDNMKELARLNWRLHMLTQTLEQRIEKLEQNNESKE